MFSLSLQMNRYVLIDMFEIVVYMVSAFLLMEAELLPTFKNTIHVMEEV